MKLSIVDKLFLAMETRQCPTHVAGLMIFQIPANYDGNYTADLVERLRNQRKVSTPFNLVYRKSLWAMGHASYVRDNKFDLDYHLKHFALPKPGTMDQLNALAAHLHGIMLDRNRPLWECHIIEGIEGNRFAIYLKLHHSQFDGKAALRIVHAALSNDPEDRTIRPFWQMTGGQWEQERSNGSMWNALEAIPLKLGQHLVSMSELTRHWLQVSILKTLFNEDLVPFPFEAPATVFNKNISGQRIFSQASLPLDEVKRFSKETDSTVNDVALTVCSGAMRRYLINRQELPDKSLIGFVPVSLPPKQGAGANRATGVQCHLGTDIDDPVKRFNHIRSSMKRNKELVGQLSEDAFQKLPVYAQAPLLVTNYLKMADQTPCHSSNAIISNVPGSQRPFYFYGAKLEALYPLSALSHGNGLNVTLSSHENKLNFGILSCRSLMPDLGSFAKYIHDSFAELTDAFAEKNRTFRKQKKETNPPKAA